MRLINVTPHKILLNNGESYETSGSIARVSSSYTAFNEDGICEQTFGQLTGLPESQVDTCYIVSAMVLAAAKAVGRTDCVAPATGHPEVIRNEAGQIISVPGFVI